MSDIPSAARPDLATSDGSRVTEPEIIVPAPSSVLSPGPTHGPSDRATGSEPLARIEDKASRIEEKIARSEASMQRVVDRFELASARMGEVALQSDLAALRAEVAAVARRVRRSAGPASLALTAIATAILTAVAVVLVMRYAPAALAR